MSLQLQALLLRHPAGLGYEKLDVAAVGMDELHPLQIISKLFPTSEADAVGSRDSSNTGAGCFWAKGDERAAARVPAADKRREKLLYDSNHGGKPLGRLAVHRHNQLDCGGTVVCIWSAANLIAALEGS